MSTIGYYICVPFAWLVRLFYNLTVNDLRIRRINALIILLIFLYIGC